VTVRVLLFPFMIGLCSLLALLTGGPHAGRAVAEIDGHRVIVADCYRRYVPPVEEMAATPEGEEVYRFAPCRHTEVVIQGDRLHVNGALYGTLNPESTIRIRRGEVVVNRMERDPLPPPR
jgi:hypothetical protein